MALEISEFWNLLIQSQLLTHEQCQQLGSQFTQSLGKTEPQTKALAEWLVRQKKLTKYQAKILYAGRPGPFFYGDYKIYDRVESGRLAGSFRAVHAATNHPVLLKFLAGPVTQSPPAWQEALTWIPLTSHAHIARCFEAVDLGSYKFLVYEDLRGQSVSEMLDTAKRIPADEAGRLGKLAAQALAWLHEHGRVHGDVRPHNMWVEPNGNVKLLVDPEVGTRLFNLSTVASEPDGLVRADYAAPEFMQPGRLPDAFTDIYAMGSTLYHLLAGKPPFADGDATSKLRRHATEAIQPLESIGVPAPLMQLVAYAMAKNPAVRYQKVAVVAEQLGPFIGAAQHNFKPMALPSTLASYESWLQQKQAARATTQGVELVGAVPGTAIAVSAPGAVPSDLVSVATSPRTSSAALAIRRKARMRRRKNIVTLVLTVLVLVAVVIGGVAMMNRPLGPDSAKSKKQNDKGATSEKNPPAKDVKREAAQEEEDAPPKKPRVTPGSKGSDSTAGNTKANTTNVAAAAGAGAGAEELLWSAPTTGSPIELKFVPPGAQLFLVARPAEIVASPEGQRVLKSLGPQFESARTAWETSVGVKLEEIELLVLALFGNQGKYPRSTVTVRLKEEITPEGMLTKWGSPVAVDGTIGAYQKGEAAYYLPANDKHVFVVGPLDPEIKDVATAEGKPPLLRREMGQLLQSSDEKRHVTLLFAPNFLTADGQELFAGERSRALGAIDWLLSDGLKAGMVSMQFDENFYFELRMESDIQTNKYQLASQVRGRLAEIPEVVETQIAKLNPHPYWRLVANRYPGMIRFLHQQSRIGVEGNHAVVNAVLPGVAAHNLVFGGEMMLASAAGTPVAPVNNGPAGVPAPQNIVELLKAKMSIAFAADSLEFSMQNVANEVKATYPGLPFEFVIKILGPDLEKDGITRNQQVRDFNQQDKSVAEVLTAMVMKANPITTVKAPNELDQKLIWVVGPDPADATKQILLVTTRAAAEQKKYTLPEVFRPK